MKVEDNKYPPLNKPLFLKFLQRNKIDIDSFMDEVFVSECSVADCYCPLIQASLHSELRLICYEKLSKFLSSINNKDFINLYLDYISNNLSKNISIKD